MTIKENTEIVNRFFGALAYLINTEQIRGKATFCKRYEINRRNLYLLEKNPERAIFQPAWLTFLVRDYKVSARWLLTGDGKIQR